MWRYRELLPIENEPTVGLQTGFTPLIRARRLAERLGVDELYIKNDTVNYPTLSFKDRVVAVALSRAKELGIDTVACASTGNLANSVAANAASAGLRSFVLIPADLEPTKILGSLVFGTNVIGIQGAYDQVNRLCSEIAGKYHWGFVNVNLRPYYAEGSKTMGFEIIEQLGWRLPRHTVVCMASGSLLTKIHKSFTRIPQTWARRARRMQHLWRSSGGMLPDHHCDQEQYGGRQAGCQTSYDRQIVVDRHSCRRLLRHPDDERNRRYGRRLHGPGDR